MADVKIEFDLGGIKEVRVKLERLQKATADLGPLCEAIREQLVRSHAIRAEQQVDPQGHKWKALNPLYAAGKKGGRILRRDGTLLEFSSRVEGSAVIIGSSPGYAAAHQFGAIIRPKNKKALRFQMGGKWFTRRSVTIPPRPFLGVSEQDRQDMVETVQDYIEEALKG